MDAPEVVRELFAAFARGDSDTAQTYVHPDCSFWPEGTAAAMGRTEPYAGPEGVVAYFADVAAAWDSLVVETTDVRSIGTGVICFGVAVGRLRGEVEEQRIPVLWVFRLRDDKIVFGRAAASAAEARELVTPDAA
jgi:ketosteroid isomerase-like protein